MRIAAFELEAAAVSGIDGRDLTPGHIAGYLIGNDRSARDLPKRGSLVEEASPIPQARSRA